jgi:DNA-binding response OmpR family regulator
MLLPSQTRLVRFGVFEFDLASGDLWKAGRRIRLQNQPRQVLRILVSRRGELVTRDELRRELWPDDTFVDFDNGLNVAIRKIRDAVGDLAPSPRFIETELGAAIPLRRAGYRSVCTGRSAEPVAARGYQLRDASRFVSVQRPNKRGICDGLTDHV